MGKGNGFVSNMKLIGGKGAEKVAEMIVSTGSTVSAGKRSSEENEKAGEESRGKTHGRQQNTELQQLEKIKKLEQENTKLKQKNTRLEQENARLKQKNARLKQENAEVVKVEEKYKELKSKSLVELRKRADQAEAEGVYSKLFGEIGLAIQKLFALAKEEEERETYRRILEEEIQYPIKEAFQMFEVDFEDEGISLPVRQAKLEPGLMKRLEKLSIHDLEDAAGECERRIERAKIYEIPKGALNGAAGSLHRLIETPAAELDRHKMKELASEIEKAFEDSELYPLFRRDQKILERPDLCTLYIEVRGNALIWPGLFMKKDGKLQMYGNFQGTCHKGEWDNADG